MARIRLQNWETSSDELPRVCMVCGKRAATCIDKNFSWYPDWVRFTIFLGVLPYVILAFALRKYMAVEVPVCGRHRTYFRDRAIGIGLLACIPFVVGGLVAGPLLMADNENPSAGVVGGLACFGISVLPVIAIIGYIQTTTIRPKEITDRSITLVRVDEDFVDAVRSLRHNDQFADRRPRRRGDREVDDETLPPRRRRSEEERQE